MPITIDVFNDNGNKMFQGVRTYLINDYPMLKLSDKKNEEIINYCCDKICACDLRKILVFM